MTTNFTKSGDTLALLPEQRAAERLGLSVKTLRNWRVSGAGPCFVKLGRCVRYRDADITAFIQGRLQISTSVQS